jgi:hypothetical protein
LMSGKTDPRVFGTVTEVMTVPEQRCSAIREDRFIYLRKVKRR